MWARSCGEKKCRGGDSSRRDERRERKGRGDDSFYRARFEKKEDKGTPRKDPGDPIPS